MCRDKIACDAGAGSSNSSLPTALPMHRRRLACLVCRRWRRLADHPSLLSSLDVTFEGGSWAQRFLDFATWLPQRAAHVQQLSVSAVPVTDGPPPWPSKKDGGCAFEASVGLLAACGAAHQLSSLSWQLGSGFQQDRWLPALRTLRHLSSETFHEAEFGSSLAPLTALEELELAGMPTILGEGLRLPPSLTALHIRYLQADLLPEQVRCSWCTSPSVRMPMHAPSAGPRLDCRIELLLTPLPIAAWFPSCPQLRPLSRLHSLGLSLMPLTNDAYPGLTAVSGSLRTLALAINLALPASLPHLSGLEALCIHDQGRVMEHDEGEPAAILAAALGQLTALTRLALVTPAAGAVGAAPEQPLGPSPLIPAALPLLANRSRLRSLLLVDDVPAGQQLPPGLSGLRQLAAPAQLLAASAAALASASSLQLLGLLACDAFLGMAEPAEFFGLQAFAVQLPELEQLLLVASDELAEDAHAALLGAFLWVRDHGDRLPNNFSFMVVPDAFQCPEIVKMASRR